VGRLLFIVEHTFAIPGRGVALIPGIVPQEGEAFRAGDALELRRPDGSVVTTRIGSLELLCPRPRPEEVTVMLPISISKADVPLGTQVWSV
jgi:hypothetical protein